MREIVLNGRRIADELPAYIIAEVGHNHGGKFDTARTMIQTAAAAGAHAVKLQKRDVDTLYSFTMLQKPYENEHSFGKTYGDHRRALEFGAKEYLACRSVAHTAKVDFFATAFDEPSADFLMHVDVPAIKIASSGMQDHALLRYVASLGKPMIISTGGAFWSDIDAAVDIMSGTDTPYALLHATAAYPVHNIVELNLKAIPEMRERYPNTVIGFSSHSPGIAMSLIAYAYGARIIEHHVTLNRASKGTDHAFSLEPKGLAVLCEDLLKAHVANGDGVKRMYDSERAPLSKMRRTETAFGLKITGVEHVCH